MLSFWEPIRTDTFFSISPPHFELEVYLKTIGKLSLSGSLISVDSSIQGLIHVE
jgi:hypothetical protein